MPKPLRQTSESPQLDSPRKRRRVVSDDEFVESRFVNGIDNDIDIDIDDSQRFSNEERDINRDDNISVVPSPDPSLTPERAFTPDPSGLTAPPFSRSNSNASGIASKRRPKKKANTVYSDDEDYMEAVREANIRDDRDEDFVPDSPPARKVSKKAIIAKVKRGRGPGKEKGESEIKIRDERKIAKATVDDGFPPTSASSTSRTLAGTKRRRGDYDAKDVPVDVESLPATQSTSTVSNAPPDERLPTSQPVPPKKKLPTIKKNKSLASVSGKASGPSTPSASSSNKGSSLLSEPNINKKDLGLPKKPGPRMEFKSETERMGVIDLDLSKPDIYANLFKKSGTTPHSAERRKELDRMRDQARAERMAMLNRTSFDLLAGQDKIARFEAELKQRNSTALYPHHLASYLKNKMATGQPL